MCSPVCCALAADRLVQLVPADAGLCLEGRSLADHVQRFIDGTIYQRLTNYPPVRQWYDENGPAMEQASLEIERHLGVGPQRLFEELLADEALLAVWPPSAAEADDGPALAIVRARDMELLSRLIDALCEAQRHSGLLRPDETYASGDRSFTVRVIEPEADKPPVLLAVLGEHGVATNSRRILQQVVDLYCGVDANPDSLADSAVYRAALGRVNPDAALTVFANPRVWDAMVVEGHRQAVEAGEPDDHFPDTWSQVEYAVAALTIGQRIAAEGFIAWAPESLPHEVSEVVGSFSGAAEFVHRVPAGALIALAGRVDVGRLTRLMLADGAGVDARRKSAEELSSVARGFLTGVDLFDDILAGVGPDVGAYLAAAPQRDADSLPFDLVVGIDTQPRWSGDMVPAVSDVLDHALRTALGMLVVIYNSDRGETAARLETSVVEGRRLTAVSGVEELGRDRAPAYAFDEGLLLAGSSIAVVQQAATLGADESLGSSPALVRLSNPRISGPSHVLYVNFSGLRDLLAEHPGVLRSIQQDKQLSDAAARRSLDELIALLSLADALAVELKIDATGLAASATLAADLEQ